MSIRRAAVLLGFAALLSGTLAAPALAKAPSPATLAAYLAEDNTLVQKYAGLEEGKLPGVSLPGGPRSYIEVKQSPAYVLPGEVGAKKVEAGALTGYAWGEVNHVATHTPAGCEITIAVASHALHIIDSVIAHEVFHCYEQVMSVDQFNWERKPEPHWLIEGAATWVAMDLVGRDQRPQREELGKYFESPSTPLFDRDYDGVGFFAHMQSAGISPWTRFKQIFAAESNEAAYNAAVGGNMGFLNTEASVFFREPRGWPWAERPESEPVPGSVHFKAPTVAIGSSPRPLKVKPYADGVYHLVLSGMSSRKPVLEIKLLSGVARIESLNGEDVDQLITTPLKLCSESKGCNCPGQDEHIPVFRDGNLAVTGTTTGAEVELVPQKRCETPLAAPSCETILPGYSTAVANALEVVGKHFEPTGKFSKIEAVNRPAGFSSTTCLFLFDGSLHTRPVEGANAEGSEPPPTEEFFYGSIASGVNVSRYATEAQAQADLQIPFNEAKNPEYRAVAGIGNEAWLRSKLSDGGAHGEPEYESVGFVRKRNLTAYFFIAGQANAGPTEALGLLRQVAARL
ncbi:MAG: hypothetical protein ABSG93_02045 [Solirubrobacteraceae bacterium]